MSVGVSRAVAVVGCLAVLSACSEPGVPVPTRDRGATSVPSTAQPTTTVAEDDRHGAPAVENPLDASKQLADPCSSLTPDQLRALGLGRTIPGEKDSFGRLGPYCSWRDAATDLEDFTVGYATPLKNGLADVYLIRESGRWAYFEPTTVNGYPAVFKDAGDQRARGGCNIAVGISQELHITVFSRGAEPSKACGQVEAIASAVIDTLKKNGG